jgi:hypothetical protein
MIGECPAVTPYSPEAPGKITLSTTFLLYNGVCGVVRFNFSWVTASGEVEKALTKFMQIQKKNIVRKSLKRKIHFSVRAVSLPVLGTKRVTLCNMIEIPVRR